MISQFDSFNVTRIASAFGVKLGYSDYKSLSGSFNYSGAQYVMNNEVYPLVLGSVSISDLAIMMASNFGLTGDLFNVARNYIQSQIEPLKFMNRGGKIADIVNMFCDLVDDPSFGQYAINFNLHVNNAASYSQIKYLPNTVFDVNSALSIPTTPSFKVSPSTPTRPFDSGQASNDHSYKAALRVA